MTQEGQAKVSGILRGAWLLALAVSIGIAAAFVGGLLIGWASTSRPSTLSQAIQQVNKGALPPGNPPSASTPTRTTTTSPSSVSPQSLYESAFFGYVLSVSASELGVETKAGQVEVGLTANTQFATVDVARSNRSSVTTGRLVLIVPASSTSSSAGMVVLPPK